MQIALVSDNIVTQIGHYREVFPNVSFTSSGPDDAWLLANGAMRVSVFKPYNRLTQSLVTVAPYVEDGQVFTVQVAALTQAHIDAMVESEWASIRDRRKFMLVECDWTQLSDAPLSAPTKALWVTYRQALRDITEQADPYSVVWPTAPA